MKDRIKQIMENENMNPARFADTLQIGRAVISHILNGRNNPSLDVITRILSVFPKINSDWLISGNGSMYKYTDGVQNIHPISSFSEKLNQDTFQQDLFSQNYTEPSNHRDKIKYDKEEELTAPPKEIQHTVNEVIKYVERPSKKISRIIIYYTDNTYETFNPENN